jgi:phosphopantetheinyl transferase (holo-ACP synthase)
MDGNSAVSAQDFADYLSQLLGRRISPDEWVRLSSGQQARAGGWLIERGISIADLRSRLSAPFQPTLLLEGRTAAVPSAPSGYSERPIDRAVANLRIGIDIQRIDEFLPADAGFDLKASSELNAIFTLREISYAQSRPTPLETLSGLFAAKEALRKCDAALLALPLLEVEVLPGASGRPEYPGFALSISHSGGFAIAVAAAQLIQPGPALSVAQTNEASTPIHSPATSQRSMNRFVVKTVIITVALTLSLLTLYWLSAFRLHN